MKIKFGRRDDYFTPGEYWNNLRDDIIPDIELSDVDEVKEYINNKINEMHYKSYYQKMIIGEGWIEIDFGDWTHFFCVYDIPPHTMNAFIN